MGPWTMSIRIPIFNREYMKKNFESEHKNSDIRTPLWGYPDFGSGYYSKKLSYANWLKLSSALRVHMNTMEYISIALFSTLVLGLFAPCLAAGLGYVWVLSRFYYAWVYMKDMKSLKFASGVSLGVVVLTSILGIWKVYNHIK
jgi:uncharacterized membrane protein YecN with MAPEG domain